jgi:hypothetical protein
MNVLVAFAVASLATVSAPQVQTKIGFAADLGASAK